MTCRLTLRTAIPLLLLVFAGMIAVGGLVLMTHSGEEDVEREAHADLRYLMDIVQGNMNTLLRRNDLDAIRSELTSLATDERIQIAILADDSGQILFAIDRHQVAKTISEVAPSVSETLSSTVVRGKAG